MRNFKGSSHVVDGPTIAIAIGQSFILVLLSTHRGKSCVQTGLTQDLAVEKGFVPAIEIFNRRVKNASPARTRHVPIQRPGKTRALKLVTKCFVLHRGPGMVDAGVR